jgi:transmembrane sensor
MTAQDAMIDEQALDWVIRTRDPDFADWDGFTTWLEAAPDHARAYDIMAAADADLPALLPPATVLPDPANDAGPPLWRRWRWPAAGLVAAALVAVVSVGTLQRADPYSVTTSPGERREIALEDGTRIALNGGTSIRLDRANPRLAVLDRGEAMFTVTHDASDPFRVQVGGAVLEDAGTVFNVSREAGMTRVGVAEGAVIYNPKQEAIALPAGRALQMADGFAAPKVGGIATDAVGSWHAGRLVYSDAPVAEIATDIARNLGVIVRTEGSAGKEHFTGTILLDRDPARFFAGAAPLLGLKAERRGQGWLLKEADATPH